MAGSNPAESVDQHTTIEEALAELSPLYRAPLLLYSYYGFSVREVAETLSISEGAVKTRLHQVKTAWAFSCIERMN